MKIWSFIKNKNHHFFLRIPRRFRQESNLIYFSLSTLRMIYDGFTVHYLKILCVFWLKLIHRPWRQELIESWLFHCYLPSNYGVVLYFDIPDTPKPEDKTHLCQVILNLAQWLCGRGFPKINRTGVFYSPYGNECKVTLHCFQELPVQGIKHRDHLHSNWSKGHYVVLRHITAATFIKLCF